MCRRLPCVLIKWRRRRTHLLGVRMLQLFLAVDATEILNGDGFGYLLAVDFSLEDYAQAFLAVGMPEVRPIFDRVRALIPVELQAPDKLAERLAFLRPSFEELNTLLYEFFDVTTDVNAVLSRYVRKHRDDFAEYVDG